MRSNACHLVVNIVFHPTGYIYFTFTLLELFLFINHTSIMPRIDVHANKKELVSAAEDIADEVNQ